MGVCDQVMEELQPYVDATAQGMFAFDGQKTQRTGAVAARSPAAAALWAHDTVLQACDHVLAHQRLRGRNPKAVPEVWQKAGGVPYQLSMCQVMKICAGETAQFIHQDKTHYVIPLPESLEPELAVMWSLTDFTERNGATLVVPGSHTWTVAEIEEFQKSQRSEQYKRAATSEMPKGSVLIYASSTLHAGGDNITEDPRWGLRVAYNCAFLRQEENQYLACPASIARKFPERLQALLGYDSLGLLGYVADTHHPMSVLKAGWCADNDEKKRWDVREVSSAKRLMPTKYIINRLMKQANADKNSKL